MSFLSIGHVTVTTFKRINHFIRFMLWRILRESSDIPRRFSEIFAGESPENLLDSLKINLMLLIISHFNLFTLKTKYLIKFNLNLININTKSTY